MSQKLNGKVAVITGASAGIGWASALALAREGARLALTARRQDRLEGLLVEINALGSEAVIVASDARRKQPPAKRSTPLFARSVGSTSSSITPALATTRSSLTPPPTNTTT